MKKFLFVYAAVWAAALFSGCSKDDKGNNDYVPSAKITTAFQAQFPASTNVKWIKSGMYERVSFTDSEQLQAEAWYMEDARCMLSQKTLQYDMLPAAVKQAFQSSGNSDWEMNHVDHVSKMNFEPAYVVEVKEPGINNFRIQSYRYTKEGNFLEKKSGSLSDIENARFIPTDIPSSAISHLYSKYPDAIRIDGIHENERFVIKIKDININKSVIYGEEGNWIHTGWKIEVQEIPAGAKDKIIENGHEISYISEAEEIETPAFADHYYSIKVITPSGSWYQYNLFGDGSEVLL